MKKAPLIVIGVVVLLIAIGTATGANNSSNQQSNSKTEQKQEPTQAVSSTPKLEYEIVDRIDNKTDENISVLIKSEETNPEGIALEIKNGCKKNCNISLYDDKRALDLESQYSKLSSSEAMTKWKKDNYVFVAEHFVATVGYGNTENWGYGPYSEYPMKDWYYKELKGEK